MPGYDFGVTAVASTPTFVAVVHPSTTGLLLKNRGPSTVYLGGPDVTSNTGFPVAAGSAVPIPAPNEDESLFGIVDTGTASVAYLQPPRRPTQPDLEPKRWDSHHLSYLLQSISDRDLIS
jgi:hypothetical protein